MTSNKQLHVNLPILMKSLEYSYLPVARGISPKGISLLIVVTTSLSRSSKSVPVYNDLTINVLFTNDT